MTTVCGDDRETKPVVRSNYNLSDMTVSEMMAVCRHPVGLHLKSHQLICGNVYTIDPLSRSVVLLQHFCDGHQKVKIVFAPEVTEITVFMEDDVLPDGCLKYSDNVWKCLSSLFSSTQNSTPPPNEVKMRKEKLIKWLEENTIEVVEEADGSLVVFGSVRICDPFTSQNCFCDVPIVLARVCKLIDAMPTK